MSKEHKSFLISTLNYEHVFGPFDSLLVAKTAQGRIGNIVKSETKIEEACFKDGWYQIQNGSRTRIKL